MPITKFTVLGLRCSGTNFVEAAISANFDLALTWEYGWKHWIGYHDFTDSDDTLFVGVTRHPVDWVRSFYRTPHHLASPRRANFLEAEVRSVARDGSEVMQDRNSATGERYKNIFELRSHKCAYLLDTMPTAVRHYALIRHEDLKDRYEETLDDLRRRFDLTQKRAGYEVVSAYVGQKIEFPRRVFYQASEVLLPWVHRRRLATSKILARLDVPLEQRLGYLLPPRPE